MQKRAKDVQVYLDKNFPLKKNEIKTGLKYLKNNNFTLLIAILLSANTSDKQVNKVSLELFRKANTPGKMINLGKTKIKSIISSIGLSNRKSGYIVQLSRMLIEDYNGRVPRDKKELLKLPGVGNKIAGVYSINSGGEKDLPVDTHVKKCAIAWKLTKHKTPAKISEDLKKLFPRKRWSKIRYQMIFASRAGKCRSDFYEN